MLTLEGETQAAQLQNSFYRRFLWFIYLLPHYCCDFRALLEDKAFGSLYATFLLPAQRARQGQSVMATAPCMLWPFSHWSVSCVSLSDTHSSQTELHKDIKGRRVCNSLVITAESSDKRLWSIKSIWRAGWRLSLSNPPPLPPHLTCAKRKNYISLTANDWIFIAICAPPFILPVPLTDSSLHLQRWAINAALLRRLCVIRKNHTYVFHA